MITECDKGGTSLHLTYLATVWVTLFCDQRVTKQQEDLVHFLNASFVLFRVSLSHGASAPSVPRDPRGCFYFFFLNHNE